MSKTYLEQYCELSSDWRARGVCVDTASEREANHMNYVKEKALEQSGLTMNELSIIARCRHFNILKQINVYVYQYIRFIQITHPQFLANLPIEDLETLSNCTQSEN